MQNDYNQLMLNYMMQKYATRGGTVLDIWDFFTKTIPETIEDLYVRKPHSMREMESRVEEEKIGTSDVIKFIGATAGGISTELIKGLYEGAYAALPESAQKTFDQFQNWAIRPTGMAPAAKIAAGALGGLGGLYLLYKMKNILGKQVGQYK